MKIKRLLSILTASLILASTCLTSLPRLSADNPDGSEIQFDTEKYITDFSKYTGKKGGKELDAAPENYRGEFSGSVANLAVSKSGNEYTTVKLWDRVFDSDATGGYYLSLKKASDTTLRTVAVSNKWLKLSPKTYLNFPFDKVGYGISSGSQSDNALVLKNDTTYSVKVRYRVKALSDGTELQLYTGHSTFWERNVGTDKDSSFNNDVILETVSSVTDGWVTREYLYTTPKSYVGTPKTVVFGWYPVKNGSFDKTAGFEVDTDFIEVQQASYFELYSGDEEIGKAYGVPDSTKNVNEITVPVKPGYKFAGWFTDSSLAYSVSEISFTGKAVSGRLYAAWNEAEKSTEVDADTYPDEWKSNNAIFSGTELSNEAYTGEKSFRMTGDAFMRLYGKSGNPFAVVNGNQYLFSFMYKSKSEFTASLITAAENDISVSAVTHSESKLAAATEWTKAFILLKGENITANNDTFYFKVNGENVLIDDIKLSSTSKIRFETNGGEPMTDLEGNLGDKAYLTDPNYEGHKFGGWYYDSELLRKCTDVNFPTNTDVLTLYAAWDVEEPTAFVDFEDDPYSALKLKYNGGYYIDGSVSEITDSDAFEGKKALHFNYVGGNGKNASTLNSFALYANGESGKELLKSGSDITYSISFWYKVKSADTDIRVALSTVGANNWYVKNKVHAGGAVIEKETAGGDWNRAVFYVTAKPNTNDDGTLCDSMYLLINPLEDKSCELLIDSVTVQRYGGDKSLVTLSIDDGTTEYRTVKTGDKITLPIPQKENYRFVGWYSDSDYKNSVADVYKVEGNAVLYAKWSLLTTTMIFDDFPADWAEKKSGNFKLTTRAYLTKIDENTALEFKADNEWETALTQMYKAGTSEVIRAAFGDCYRVTFR